MSLDTVTDFRYSVEILSYSYIPVKIKASSANSVYYEPLAEINSRSFGRDEYLDVISPTQPSSEYVVEPVFNFVTSFTVNPVIRHHRQDSTLLQTLRPPELQRVIPHEYNMAILAHLISNNPVQVEEGEEFLFFMKTSIEEYAIKNGLLKGKGLLNFEYDENEKNVFLDFPFLPNVKEHVELNALGKPDAKTNSTEPDRNSIFT